MNASTDLAIGDFYTPNKVQSAFHESLAKYPLSEGGRGGGKTTALLWEAIRECLLVAGCNCLLLRRTLTAVEKGGIEDHFVKNVPKKLYKSHNQQKHIVKFHNGSKLFFGHIRTDKDLLQYQGAEFLFIGWEELTQFTFSQWDYMKGSNRCPIKSFMLDGVEYKTKPRMAGATNPNGRGSGWVKALWITKRPPAGEMLKDYDPKDYEAIHSTYEDNFVYRNDSDYIKILNSISDPVLRAAWIPGSWEVLAGQFFQNWDAYWNDKAHRYEGRHVRMASEVRFDAWDKPWISIDWGFQHASVILWWRRGWIKDELDRTRNVIVCYRELVCRHANEELLAERIAKANIVNERPDEIDRIFLSPDRFAKTHQEHSIADTMGDVLLQWGLPRPERANNARIDGWRLIYTLLDTDNVVALNNCRDVIESIPKLMRSEKDPEDAEKEGNELFLDVCESFRYGVMSYASPREKPREEQMQDKIKAIKDPTQKLLEYMRLTSKPAITDAAIAIPQRGPGWRRRR